VGALCRVARFFSVGTYNILKRVKFIKKFIKKSPQVCPSLFVLKINIKKVFGQIFLQDQKAPKITDNYLTTRDRVIGFKGTKTPLKYL
jgi:hypothetical protein